MQASLSKLLAKTDEVHQLLGFYEALFLVAKRPLLRLPVVAQDPHVATAIGIHKSSPALLRQFLHQSAVVALYGAWEQFVDDIVIDTIAYRKRMCPNFSDLPPRLIEAQLLGCNDMMQKGIPPHYPHLTINSIIATLHGCYNMPDNYDIINETFLYKNNNCKAQVLSELMSRIGIADILSAMRKTDSYTNYLQAKHGPGHNKIDVSKIFFPLDDLVSRRNEVSHGSPSQVLDIQELRELTDYVAVISKALTNAVRASLISELMGDRRCRYLGNAIQIVRRKVICFRLVNHRVAVGDWIVGRPVALPEQIRASPIEEIQINGQSYPFVPKRRMGVEVGIKVDFNARPNYEYILISSGYSPN